MSRHPVPDRPGPGQESVWDYPRPPAVRATSELVEVHLGGHVVASTRDVLQVLETSHPPTYYLPVDAFGPGTLVPTEGSTACEWKGQAAWFDVVAGGVRAVRAAWSYPDPVPEFERIRGRVAVMAGLVDGCFVDGEQVRPQEGGFYGGWITHRVAGPFKGGPGSWGW